MMSAQSYVLVESIYYLHERSRICYGIALIEEDDSDDTILQTICDISTDRQHVMEFVGLCNRMQPSKESLMDLLEQFLR